jgi:hypothetical protein
MKLPLTNTMLKKMYKRKTDNRMRAFGETDLGKHTIRINKKKAKKKGTRGEVLDSIIHEKLHTQHPRMRERSIIRLAHIKHQKMKRPDKQKMYSLFP